MQGCLRQTTLAYHSIRKELHVEVHVQDVNYKACHRHPLLRMTFGLHLRCTSASCKNMGCVKELVHRRCKDKCTKKRDKYTPGCTYYLVGFINSPKISPVPSLLRTTFGSSSTPFECYANSSLHLRCTHHSRQ